MPLIDCQKLIPTFGSHSQPLLPTFKLSPLEANQVSPRVNESVTRTLNIFPYFLNMYYCAFCDVLFKIY